MTPPDIDHHLDQVLRATGCELRHLMPSTKDRARKAMAEAMGAGWQPIDTAPHQQKVLGAYRTEAGKWRRVLARYYPEKTLYADEFGESGDEEGYAPAGWYEETDAHEFLHPCEPTHWMPLPLPPTEEAGRRVEQTEGGHAA